MENHGEYLHEVRLGRNKKYHFVGQLLQGRYRSEIIDDDGYRTSRLLVSLRLMPNFDLSVVSYLWLLRQERVA